MMSVILMVLLSGALWWWYFELRDNALRLGCWSKWMFRRQLILSWAVTIITVAHLACIFLGPERYGEASWL